MLLPTLVYQIWLHYATMAGGAQNAEEFSFDLGRESPTNKDQIS